MPQAIPYIIAAAQAAYSAAVNFIAAPLVGALGEGGAVLVAQATVNIAINATIAVASSLAFRPEIPDSEFARSTRKQAIPPRLSGYGRSRIGGPYMLWEASGDFAYIVLAQHDGLTDAVEKLYLNDQVATVSGGYVQRGSDDRYGTGSDLVQIAYRAGLPTETRYSEIADTTLWPTNARGDGIASLLMIAKASNKEYFLRDYPNGLPIPSTVRRLQLCWDPRLGARGTIDDDADKLASATWAWTDNPILILLDYKTAGSGGPGYDVAKFLPRISDWIAAADVCDEPVALKAGGTEKRYRAGGTYLHQTADADVTATILATCDGWFGQDIDGYYTVQAGKYYDPTVTITADHIVGMQVSQGKRDEESTNEVIVSFTDPTFDYTEVETDPIQTHNYAEPIRSQRLSLPWVQSNAQAQRLGKIALYKAQAPISGTIVVTLDGLRAWGERRIRIQCDPSESVVMQDIVVDIQPVTLNPDFTVSIPFVSCDPTAYDWDAATEEGDGPGDDVSPNPEPIPVPVINSAYQNLDTIAVEIATTVPGSTYVVRWRPTGSLPWTSSGQVAATYIGSDTDYVTTFSVTPDNYEVQVAYVTGGGAQSEWSTSVLVTVT